ncbi:MAG: amidohydrolase family protein [Alphaproteobacteria bacterium]|nr:amidohydrolase family protein [Alphaproteobacteria bacterium]
MTGLLALLPAALAQDCTVFFEGVTAYLPDGPQEGVSVRVAGARIDAVGAELSGEGCAATIDGRGRVLTPGLIDPNARIGLVEVGLEDATHNDGGGHAAYGVYDGYNPRSSVVPVVRIAGLTSAIVMPERGRVSGQAAAVDLAGATQADAVIDPSVAMVAHIGNNAAEGLDELRTLLDDARAFGANPTAYDQNRTRTLGASRRDLEALQPVLKGDLPLVIGADKAADIEAVLRFARDQRVRVVIRGAAEGWLVADQLAEAEVPVILDPLVYGPGSFDQIHGRADNPALLHAAGVPIMFGTGSAHFARALPQLAGNAVRGGLDHDAALVAITATPAEVFGLTDYGRIEPGAMANLVLWSGDPLELSTHVLSVHIRGRDIPLESRQTKLQERYLELPGTPTPPTLK